MPSLTAANGTPISAAMLTDPKALKKHLANGTPTLFHFEPSFLPARGSSEPPQSESCFEATIVPDTAPQRSKDDAYFVLEYKGNKAMGSQNAAAAGQIASSTFDPRRLLDPKGFNNYQRQRDSQSASTQSTLGQSSPSNPQPNGKPSETNGNTIETNSNPSKINGNGLRKRDHEDYENQGMGSLIEKVHNVSQREERLQKKPKVEKSEFDVEEDRKACYVGGGKGGEIGDYLKERKKQGIAESGPVNAVVDLTGGTCLLLRRSVLVL